jgi:hypothetical protein
MQTDGNLFDAGIHPQMSLRRILEALPRFRYRLSNEESVQSGIAEVLKLNGIGCERERAIEGDRFDFLCAGGVAIEVKVDGSYSEVVRQVERYCRREEVTAVVVATTRHWPDATLEFSCKPVHIVHLRGRAF